MLTRPRKNPLAGETACPHPDCKLLICRGGAGGFACGSSVLTGCNGRIGTSGRLVASESMDRIYPAGPPGGEPDGHQGHGAQ